MTTKTKQEAQCCAELAVRCARAEMERDAAKESGRISQSYMAAMSERDHNRDLAFSKLREDYKDLKDRHAALRELHTRTLLANEALCCPKPRYECERPIVIETGADWSFVLFVSLCLSGGLSWVYCAYRLIEFLVGRFA